jgi:hypothetical protein
MPQDEFFPLDAVPPLVRRALLREFQGRRPTLHEVSQISDRHWLATPDIGPSTLETIHSILRPQPGQREGSSPEMTDDELLNRLEFIQEELKRIQCILEARIGPSSRKRRQAEVSKETLSQVDLWIAGGPAMA